jgi:hypothetical protein
VPRPKPRAALGFGRIDVFVSLLAKAQPSKLEAVGRLDAMACERALDARRRRGRCDVDAVTAALCGAAARLRNESEESARKQKRPSHEGRAEHDVHHACCGHLLPSVAQGD